MAFPYTVTISGLQSTIRQLRSAFPSELTPDTLRKWGIAPNNETYVLPPIRKRTNKKVTNSFSREA